MISVISPLRQTGVRSNDGRTALDLARYQGHQKIVALLSTDAVLASGALRQADQRLLKASKSNQWPEAKLALDKQAADVNCRDTWGRSPLHWFAEHGNGEAICELVRKYEAHTSAVCNENKTPLHYTLTAKSHKTEVCNVLAKAMAETREGINQVETYQLMNASSALYK